MLKVATGIITALLVLGFSSAHGQMAGAQDQPKMGQVDLKTLTDARLRLVKAALQLTPEQEKNWPALEEAIKARSAARQQRLTAYAETLRKQDEVDPFVLLRERADNMAQRGAELKKLVDAWQPLWQGLNPEQKVRMVILARHVLRVVGNAPEARRMEMDE